MRNKFEMVQNDVEGIVPELTLRWSALCRVALPWCARRRARHRRLELCLDVTQPWSSRVVTQPWSRVVTLPWSLKRFHLSGVPLVKDSVGALDRVREWALGLLCA